MIKADVNRAAVQALLRYLPDTVAREVVRAIIRGEIPNVAVSYGEVQ